MFEHEENVKHNLKFNTHLINNNKKKKQARKKFVHPFIF